MIIEYEISEQDYINFNMDYIYSWEKTKPLTKLLLKIIPLVLVFILVWTLRKDLLFSTVGIITFSIIFLIVFFILDLFEPKITGYFTRKILLSLIKNGKANTFIGKQTIKLTEEYIEDGNETKVSKIKYSTVERVDFGHDLFYIYIGAVEAIIIPTNAFESEEQKNSFFDIISEKTKLDLTHIKQIKIKA